MKNITDLRANREIPVPLDDANVLIGSDVLQLLSSSMYHEPLIIYRELVQNALDSLDSTLEELQDIGSVTISIDRKKREISVLDNGKGIQGDQFPVRMCSLGGSAKREDAKQRGFRGVGRLASLGYCKVLKFASRSRGSKTIFQASWDCVRLRDFLNLNPRATINDAIKSALRLSKRFANDSDPANFFEARLEGVVRLSDDRLLDPDAVRIYLADYLPARFSEAFPYFKELEAYLGSCGVSSKHRLIYKVDGAQREINRRLGRTIRFANGRESKYSDLQKFVVNGLNGDIAALGWIAHHEYPGNLFNSDAPLGIRVRIGGIQVGDESLVSDLFPEPRFNAWCIGEVNILDPGIIPNGRRDGFEPTLQWQNVANHISVVAKTVVARCRKQSALRNSTRRVDALEQKMSKFVDCLVAFPQLWAICEVWRPAAERLFEKLSRYDLHKASMAYRRFSVMRKSSKRSRERELGVLEVIASVLRNESQPEVTIDFIIFIVQKLKGLEWP